MYFEFNFLTKENVNFARAGQTLSALILVCGLGMRLNGTGIEQQYNATALNRTPAVINPPPCSAINPPPRSLPDSVAAGNSKGFAVANFLVKRIVLVHPTVAADGLRARSLGR